jgi:DUF1680 family protein
MNHATHATNIFLVFCMLSRAACGEDLPAHHKAVIDNSQSAFVKLRCIPMQDTRLTDEGKQALLSDRTVSAAPSNVMAWQEGELYRPIKPTGSDVPTVGTQAIELIPYYAWANRGLAYMDVWIPLAR